MNVSLSKQKQENRAYSRYDRMRLCHFGQYIRTLRLRKNIDIRALASVVCIPLKKR
jgi:hypothetical protein